MPRPDVRDKRIPEILEAAIHVFSKHGIDGASMSEIADTAGVSKATIYHYFESKDELIEALVRKLFEFDRSAIDQLSNNNSPVPQRLVDYADNLALLLQQNTELAAVVFQAHARAVRVAALRELVSAFFREYVDVIRDVIKAGIGRGEVAAATDPQTAAVGYVVTVEGAIIVAQHLGKPIEEIIKTVVPDYVRGIEPA